MSSFAATIEIIGINPFVFVPDHVLEELFIAAAKNKGKIPVLIKIDGHEFSQTLIRYSGYWRLYVNTPMRKAAKKDVGDQALFEIAYNPAERGIPMHPKLQAALENNISARKAFEALRPSRQLEIKKYLSFLKQESTVDRNVDKTIEFLLGHKRLADRDKL